MPPMGQLFPSGRICGCLSLFFELLIFIKVQLIYNVVLVSTVEQLVSVVRVCACVYMYMCIYIYICIYIYMHSFSFWFIPESGYSSLCYKAGPCFLCILNVIACI